MRHRNLGHFCKIYRTISFALLAAIAFPLTAHHRVPTFYDTDRSIQLTGTVIRVEWLNPHIWIRIAVIDAQGKSVEWGCEGEAANVLYKLGWRKDSIHTGEHLIVEGFPARSGSLRMNSTSIRTSNGRPIFEGPYVKYK